MTTVSSTHSLLSDDEFARIQPWLPPERSRGRKVDYRQIISGIVHVVKNPVGKQLRWRDAPRVYGSYLTLRKWFMRLMDAGTLVRIFEAIAVKAFAEHLSVIDAIRMIADMTGEDISPSGDHYWLSEEQMARIAPLLPKSRGIARVDDRMVLSGIIHVLKSGMRWRDAPRSVYGPHKTLYNRFHRWSRMGIFERIFNALASESDALHIAMVDSTFLKAHRTSCSSRGREVRRIGRTAGGLTSKLHVVCDARGRPVMLLLTEGNINDQKGADTFFSNLPPGIRVLIGDRAYDTERFREALADLGIIPCIPGRSNRKKPVVHDEALYKGERWRIECMFSKLKDWRRVAMRYDRCAHTFMSAICIAAAVTFWL